MEAEEESSDSFFRCKGLKTGKIIRQKVFLRHALEGVNRIAKPLKDHIEAVGRGERIIEFLQSCESDKKMTCHVPERLQTMQQWNRLTDG